MDQYKDILHLPHPVSQRRAQMPLIDRAAQFAPFAALTGYDGIIAETGRVTDRSVDLDETAITELNQKLCRLADCMDRCPAVTVVYFLPDPRKDGGSYETKTGTVKKLDTLKGVLIFADRTEIPFSQLLELHISQ